MSMMRAASVGGSRTGQLLSRKTVFTPSLLRHQQHQEQFHWSAPSSHFFHTVVGSNSPWEGERRKKEQANVKLQMSSLPSMQVAQYHSTPQPEKIVAIGLGLGAVSALAYAGSSAVRAYNEYKASLPSEEEMEEQRKQQEKEDQANQQKQEATQQQQQKPAGGEKGENIFSKWFGVGVGAKYYEGGFEETMTRREAALILGVRESSPASRIKDAHRKLLVLNHPDTGGSTHVAGKINEAKELLLKGKRGK
ncbi:DnaJ homolog subfamily C member 15 [Seminavis robusta]|uniref:DnaJ homolog subfamily C member 15 n=1 Tax=Seminavis robusta TaxID=568900 RepID=A0A9N8DPC1_9STRA|nr:DnaJ homolog subfamily C member 15 [Seminavis robusta]|eukprot:Sro251_g099230.1 DnaJ homolog subfamily C member 15 (250) ;mRNA; r:28000-28749